MDKILVVGASGTVGSALVEQLRVKGHAVVRSTSRRVLQADQVHLDLITGTGLQSAFDGVGKAFFLSPPGYADQFALLGPLIDQARERKLEKVVMMTALNANAIEETPMRQAELRLERSGLTYNIIRPNWFMQNFNSFWIKGILEANTVFLPVGEGRASFIDARDIAAAAAALLDSHALDNRDFDLTGDESLTHAEAATLIGRATGKVIGFQDISSEEMLAGLLQAGLPQDYAHFLVMILGLLKQGASERRTTAVKDITGRDPIRFAQYAQDYRRAWLQPV